MKYLSDKTEPPKEVDIAAETHPGLVRECNEDSFVYCRDPGETNFFVAVADGIGGHDSGDVASLLCMREMLVHWKRSLHTDAKNPRKIRSFLDKSIKDANEKIYNLNSVFNIEHPMGTTVVAGVFLDGHVVISHAGDSRCYRLRNGEIERLTNDHSYIAELLKAKVIDPEEAKYHPFAHVISRSVGPIESLEPETNIFDTKPRDRYLFCSDGLTTHVEDLEIESVLYDASTAQSAAKELARSALMGGGEDNITVLCVFL